MLLAHPKVGEYTEEEFLTALVNFEAGGRPLIWTYFKDAPINPSSINPQTIKTLFDFKQALSNLGHFHQKYADSNDLLRQFGDQLNKVLSDLT